MILAEQEDGVTLTGQSLSIEKAFEPICGELNRTPIHVNKTLWVQKLEAAQEDHRAKEQSVRTQTGCPSFRSNSSKDCAAYFIEQGWEPNRLTGKGAVSMSDEVLKHLALTYPVANDIRTARHARAILSQLEAWEDMAEEGIVQPTWHQFGTPMGRMSCEGVALQNRVQPVRETVVAPPGYTFVSVDLKQAEYVTWAKLAKDTKLKSIFKNGLDLHQAIGDELFAYDPNAERRRKRGKRTNFAMLYGMTAPTLAADLNIDTTEAEEIIFRWTQLSPQAFQFKQDYLKEVAKTGIAYTRFGRKRHIPGLKGDRREQTQAAKTAWHMMNAGTTAELVKLKMCEADFELRATNAQDGTLLKESSTWNIQMHDEFTLLTKDEKVKETRTLLMKVMDRDAPPEIGGAAYQYKLKTAKIWGQLYDEEPPEE